MIRQKPSFEFISLHREKFTSFYLPCRYYVTGSVERSRDGRPPQAELSIACPRSKNAPLFLLLSDWNIISGQPLKRWLILAEHGHMSGCDIMDTKGEEEANWNKILKQWKELNTKCFCTQGQTKSRLTFRMVVVTVSKKVQVDALIEKRKQRKKKKRGRRRRKRTYSASTRKMNWRMWLIDTYRI